MEPDHEVTMSREQARGLVESVETEVEGIEEFVNAVDRAQGDAHTTGRRQTVLLTVNPT